jgi:CelD/BcsL family acetyltransferase involved in cellulose biosynthesis
MKLQALRSPEEFESLADEWNHLLKRSASHVPFLRHEYLKCWWQYLGGGEWDDGELYSIAARGEGGVLQGIAPLFFSTNREGQPALMFLGSIEISDYLDFIAPEDQLPTFLDALFSFLEGQGAPPWKALDLYNLPDDSPTLPLLENAARRCGWTFRQEALQHCPYIPLPGNWETYLAGIDKKQRHEIRRKMRRAEICPEPVNWRIIQDEAELPGAMEDFMSLMAQDAEKERFLTPAMRRQMQETARAAFQAGWLQLSFLQVGEKKAAGYMNFDYLNRIWVYNSGLDFSSRELSPGWVLLGYLLQWANEQGREAFDFMRGDEEYKYRFGAVDRRVVRAVIQR